MVEVQEGREDRQEDRRVQMHLQQWELAVHRYE
jgi:hypothetical protein